MRPWLIQIGPLAFPSYFTLLTVGFGLAIHLAWRRAPKAGVEPDRILDLALWMLLCGIYGARLLHAAVEDFPQGPAELRELLATQFDAGGLAYAHVKAALDRGETAIPVFWWYWEHPLEILWFWKGGLAYYGGFLLAVPVGIVYLRRKRIPVGVVADLAGPVIALGLVFGRLGCFLNGCCYGVEYHGLLSVTFPGMDHPVHPTQLYASAANLAIFLVLWFWHWPRRRFDGEVFASFLVLYAVQRFLQEMLRDDNRGLFFHDTLSTSQIIAIPLFLAGAAILIRGYLRLRRETAAAA